MNDEIKEILYKLDSISNGAYNNDGYIDLKQDEAHLLLDYITNLQQDNEMYAQLKDEYEEEIKDLQQENERLKAQLTDTEWEYQNTRCKYEKQYKKGITEELLEDIETCFFNRENPSMIPIDSLDICHIFGYIDYLKDYKSRCEKAIEYVKEHNPSDIGICGNEKKYYYTLYEDSVDNLLNILQNGSEEDVR